MDKVFDEFSLLREKVAKDIIGEIVMSEYPEKVIKKWRNIFEISQKDVAGNLRITSSVVSDYESGRRRSPGIKFVKKYVHTLLDLDTGKGGNVIRSFSKNMKPHQLSDAIIDIKEFSSGMNIPDFCGMINANMLNNVPQQVIYGYTIIDSLKAITEFSFQELIKLYGITSQRCLIFTKVSTGRTPMVAIKLTNLHPGLVVLHGLSVVDDIAKRIAEVEKIPLAVSMLESVDQIVDRLKNTE